MISAIQKPAPRTVSKGLILRKFLRNTFVIIGAIFTLFGGLFFSVFFVTSHYNALDFEPDLVQATQGVVIDTRKTNAKIDDHTVIEVIYEFKHEERIYRNRSYGTYPTNRPQAGSSVPVKFIEDDPQVSRIKGLKSGKLSPVVYFIASIFPMIGLFFITLGCFRTYGFYRILRNGVLTQAKIKSTDSRLAVFETSDGLSHTIILGNGYHSFESHVDVIFLPRKPDRAMTLKYLESMIQNY